MQCHIFRKLRTKDWHVNNIIGLPDRISLEDKN